MTVTKPKSLDDATALIARVADIDGAIAAVEARRRRAIAKAGGAADAIVAPLIADRAALVAVIEPWFLKNKGTLLKGKRKSVELGGCSIGTRTEAKALEFAHGDDKAALAAVLDAKLNGATRLVRLLDKVAIKGFVEGKSKVGVALRGLGFKVGGGGEVFSIKRVDSAEAKVSAQ
jgi:hypothetical protein